jgi:hypothetical protein
MVKKMSKEDENQPNYSEMERSEYSIMPETPKGTELEQLKIISEKQDIANKMLKASNEINSLIFKRLGWIELWLFILIILCTVGLGKLIF